jgi:hypothetical protein
MPNLSSITGDILPSVDNAYTLGNSSYRWKSINVGPGTINITDQTLLTTASIQVNNGILFINGIAQAQLPNVRVTNLTFNDNTTQTTAAVAQVNSDWNATSGKAQILNKPTFIAPSDFTFTTTTQASTLTVDFTGPDQIFWQPSANGNRAITLTNFTANKKIKIFITPHATNNTFTFTGVTASQCSNGNNVYQLGGGGAGQSSMMIELFSTGTSISGVWLFAYGGV